MANTFKYALSLMILAVAVMQFIQALARYLLHLPLPGLEELLVYPTLWLYMLGSANASRENTQITANVLDIFMKTDRARTTLRLIGQILSLVVACWLFLWVVDFDVYTRRVWKETSYYFYPLYFAEAAVPLGMGLMVAFTATNLYATASSLLQTGRGRAILRLIALTVCLTLACWLFYQTLGYRTFGRSFLRFVQVGMLGGLGLATAVTAFKLISAAKTFPPENGLVHTAASSNENSPEDRHG
jgi:TRAP-type C4-dicarboxylate transport system permease small subunit